MEAEIKPYIDYSSFSTQLKEQKRLLKEKVIESLNLKRLHSTKDLVDIIERHKKIKVSEDNIISKNIFEDVKKLTNTNWTYEEYKNQEYLNKIGVMGIRMKPFSISVRILLRNLKSIKTVGLF